MADGGHAPAITAQQKLSGLSESEAAQRLAKRDRTGETAHQSFLREHRSRQRLHRLQPDPRSRRRRDAGVRRMAGRALPWSAGRERRHRNSPRSAGQTGTRPAQRARRAAGDRCPRPRRTRVAGRGAGRRRPCAHQPGRPDRRRRQARAGRAASVLAHPMSASRRPWSFAVAAGGSMQCPNVA
jgi:hypothetical protein